MHTSIIWVMIEELATVFWYMWFNSIKNRWLYHFDSCLKYMKSRIHYFKVAHINFKCKSPTFPPWLFCRLQLFSKLWFNYEWFFFAKKWRIKSKSNREKWNMMLFFRKVFFNSFSKLTRFFRKKSYVPQ
jgi:hypothetical protein